MLVLNSTMPAGPLAKLCPQGPAANLNLLSATAPPATPPPAPAASRRRRHLMGIATAPSQSTGLQLIDGNAKRRINVTGIETLCNKGAVLFIDALPLPCELAAVKTDTDFDTGFDAGSGRGNGAWGVGGSSGGVMVVRVVVAVALAWVGL